MKLFCILNVTLYTLANGFNYMKNSRYCHKSFNLILTKDNFQLNDDDMEQLPPGETTDEENLENILKKRQYSVYEGCDQRPSLNISDPSSLHYFYKEFREVLQKHELLKKLQSDSFSDHTKLEIIKECDYLLENEHKPRINPLYKGFEEFF
jgi:hypothetical protein